MRKLDEQERIIIRELIRDPKMSDNQISLKTGVPLKSVNRKRKNLEFDNIINYFLHVNNCASGTGSFGGMDMYVIKLKHGISRKEFIEFLKNTNSRNPHRAKHIFSTYIGNMGSNLAIVKIIKSRLHSDIPEIFNCDIVPEIRKHFGEDSVIDTTVIHLDEAFRLLHNYMPMVNMKDGRIAEHWPDDLIFVDE